MQPEEGEQKKNDWMVRTERQREIGEKRERERERGQKRQRNR